MTDSYEAGLSELEELTWNLGGVDLDLELDGDEGFDDVGELVGDDHPGALDGTTAGNQTMTSREVSLTCGIAYDDDEATHELFSQQLNNYRKVMHPLPDRQATRLLRFRRIGEEGKRLYVRPANGRPLSVPGDEARLKFGLTKAVVLRLTAPDPIVYSDALHTVTFEADEVIDIVNAGSFTARTLVWSIEADGPVTITHEDFEGESITFPSTGALTVRRQPGRPTPEIIAPGTYGICHGPAGTLFPRWPLLRPGSNNIRASAACTFSWRDIS